MEMDEGRGMGELGKPQKVLLLREELFFEASPMKYWDRNKNLSYSKLKYN